MLLALVDVLLSAVEFLAYGLVGWRFLASPRYRQSVTTRWKEQPTSMVAVEVTGAAVGALVSALLLGWLLIGLIQ